jgi:hypothetical protein
MTTAMWTGTPPGSISSILVRAATGEERRAWVQAGL